MVQLEKSLGWILGILVSFIFSVYGGVSGENRDTVETAIRGKRGAAYAGPHPGNGNHYGGVGGVGIPGINNVIQYSAYNALLNSGHQGGGGHGSSHGRKLTVDQAIGMFGHHTLSQPYPYTSSGGGGGSHGSSGYGTPGRSLPIIGAQTGHGNSNRNNGYGGSSGHGGGVGSPGGGVSYG